MKNEYANRIEIYVTRQIVRCFLFVDDKEVNSCWFRPENQTIKLLTLFSLHRRLLSKHEIAVHLDPANRKLSASDKNQQVSRKISYLRKKIIGDSGYTEKIFEVKNGSYWLRLPVIIASLDYID